MLPFRDDPGLTFAGFLILAALGWVYWSASPLESARPERNQDTWYERPAQDRVAARLWEDPFRAISASCPNLANRGAGTTHQNPASSTDGAVTDRCGISAAHATGCPMAVLKQEIEQRTAAGNSILLMPVMVSSGTQPEAEEHRRRTRYATVSGLADSGFVPVSPDELGGFLWPRQNGFVVPYEWFVREEVTTPGADAEAPIASAILLMWMSDKVLDDKPIDTLGGLLEKLTLIATQYPQANARVIGPANTRMLRQMLEEQAKADEAPAWLETIPVLQFLSAHATVPLQEIHDELLLSIDSPDEVEKVDLRLLRTIRDDAALMSALADELERRQLRVSAATDTCHGRPTGKGVYRIADESNCDHVVVISEWDTFYGRSMPRRLAQELCGEDECPNLHRFSYQRGIDGLIAQRGMQQSQQTPPKRSAKTEGPLDALSGNERVRRPVGTGQYDYVRRLAEDIRDLNRELHLAQGRRIRAVFILGSDVYDKLLILRALRNQLPGAIWLTTDYDSLLQHPGDFRWARNLVVASTFGPNLPQTIRQTTPPFRDGYQGATYLAVRLAANPTNLMPNLAPSPGGDIMTQSCQTTGLPRQCELNDRLPVQLFEIGRNGPVTLGTGSPPTNSFHSLNRIPDFALQKEIAASALTIVLIALIALYSLHHLRPNSGAMLVWLAGVFALFAGLTLVFYLQQESGEPLSVTNGVSIVPSEYIRLLTLLMAVSFIFLCVRQLADNTAHIESRFLCSSGPRFEPKKPRTLKDLHAYIRKRFSVGSILQAPSWVKLILLFAVPVVIAPIVLGRIHISVFDKTLLVVIFWAGLIAIWWQMVYQRGLRIDRVNDWAASAVGTMSVEQLWRDYADHASIKHWFLRATSYMLVYMAFASLVFTWFEMPVAPCRGAIACTLDKMLLGFSILAMIYLLFIVVDATRLCLVWIDHLSHDCISWKQLPRLPSQVELPGNHAHLLYKIEMIGDRTAAVSRLVYYPVLVVLLMMLARSTYFDDWGIPQPVAIVIGLNFVVAFSSAVMLNRTAEQVRRKIVQALKDEELKFAATADGKLPQAEKSGLEIGKLIQHINDTQTGAFRKPWEQPVVRSAFLLLGGIGVTYSEFALFF